MFKLSNCLCIFWLVLLIKFLMIYRIGGDFQVVCSLEPRWEGRNHLQTCHIKCEERISQVSSIPGKKAKGMTRCAHIEWKNQGHYSIILPIQWAVCALHINQYLTKITSIFFYQLQQLLTVWFPLRWICLDHTWRPSGCHLDWKLEFSAGWQQDSHVG